MIVGQEKLPIQKTCLPRSRQAHFIIITRIWHGFIYALRTFPILSLPAKSPVSRHIKSGHSTGSNSFVLMSPRFHFILMHDCTAFAANKIAGFCWFKQFCIGVTTVSFKPRLKKYDTKFLNKN